MGCGTSGFPKMLHSDAKEILVSSEPTKKIRHHSSSSDSSSSGNERDLVLKYEDPPISRSSSIASSFSHHHEHHHYHHEENIVQSHEQRNYSFLFLDPSNVGKHDSVSDAESGIELTDQKASDLALQGGSDVFTVKDEEDAEVLIGQPTQEPKEAFELLRSDVEEILSTESSQIVEVDETEVIIGHEQPAQDPKELDLLRSNVEDILFTESSQIVEVNETDAIPPILIHKEGESQPKNAVVVDSPKALFIKLEKYEPEAPVDINMHLDDGSLILDMEPPGLKGEKETEVETIE